MPVYDEESVLELLSKRSKFAFRDAWPFTKDTMTGMKNTRLREFHDKTKIILAENLFSVIVSYTITNFADTTVYLKLDSSNIEKVQALNNILIKQKMIVDPKYTVGTFVKLTFDMTDKKKIVNQKRIEEQDFNVLAGPSDNRKFRYLQKYINFFDIYNFV
jgi:hypothetical protein